MMTFMQSSRYNCKILVSLFPPPFTDFQKKNAQRLNFVKIRPVGAELLDADGETERQTEK